MRNLTNRVAEGCRERRDTRRKQGTRARLLHAALLLLSEKNIKRIAINEITEAVDVGFGSFYDHFESKEGLFAAMIDWAFESFASKLDTITHDLTGPAEIIAIAVRHTLLRAQREPAWGRLLMHGGVSTRALTRGLGLHLLHDSKHGLAAKRFVVADPLTSVLSMIGIALADVAAELRFAAAPAVPKYSRQAAVVHVEHLAECATVFVLQALGVKHTETGGIAQLPLPEVRGGNAAATMWAFVLSGEDTHRSGVIELAHQITMAQFP